MKYGEEGLEGCAFPTYLPEEMGVREGYFDAGISRREHAALTIRVPDSGDERIDAMIRQANRRDAAVAAMQGALANASNKEWEEKAETIHELAEAVAVSSVLFADALIAKLEESRNG